MGNAALAIQNVILKFTFRKHTPLQQSNPPTSKPSIHDARHGKCNGSNDACVPKLWQCPQKGPRATISHMCPTPRTCHANSLRHAKCISLPKPGKSKWQPNRRITRGLDSKLARKHLAILKNQPVQSERVPTLIHSYPTCLPLIANHLVCENVNRQHRLRGHTW